CHFIARSKKTGERPAGFGVVDSERTTPPRRPVRSTIEVHFERYDRPTRSEADQDPGGRQPPFGSWNSGMSPPKGGASRQPDRSGQKPRPPRRSWHETNQFTTPRRNRRTCRRAMKKSGS